VHEEKELSHSARIPREDNLISPEPHVNEFLPVGALLQTVSEILLVRILVIRQLAQWELQKGEFADHVLEKKISSESLHHFSCIFGTFLLLVVFRHLFDVCRRTGARKVVVDHLLTELWNIVDALIKEHFRKNVIDHLLKVSFVFRSAIDPRTLDVWLSENEFH
jgi:hypothetical protein